MLISKHTKTVTTTCSHVQLVIAVFNPTYSHKCIREYFDESEYGVGRRNVVKVIWS